MFKEGVKISTLQMYLTTICLLFSLCFDILKVCYYLQEVNKLSNPSSCIFDHIFSPVWSFSRKLLFSSIGVIAWTNLQKEICLLLKSVFWIFSKYKWISYIFYSMLLGHLGISFLNSKSLEIKSSSNMLIRYLVKLKFSLKWISLSYTLSLSVI